MSRKMCSVLLALAILCFAEGKPVIQYGFSQSFQLSSDPFYSPASDQSQSFQPFSNSFGSLYDSSGGYSNDFSNIPDGTGLSSSTSFLGQQNLDFSNIGDPFSDQQWQKDFGSLDFSNNEPVYNAGGLKESSSSFELPQQSFSNNYGLSDDFQLFSEQPMSMQSLGLDDFTSFETSSTFKNSLLNKLLLDNKITETFTRPLDVTVTNAISAIADSVAKDFNLLSFQTYDDYNTALKSVLPGSDSNAYIEALAKATEDFLKRENILNDYNKEINIDLAAKAINGGIKGLKQKINTNQKDFIDASDNTFSPNLNLDLNNYDDLISSMDSMKDFNTKNSFETALQTNIFDASQPMNVFDASQPMSVFDAPQPEIIFEAAQPNDVFGASQPMNVFETAQPTTTNQGFDDAQLLNPKASFQDSLHLVLMSDDNFMKFLRTISREKASRFTLKLQKAMRDAFGLQSDTVLSKITEDLFILNGTPANEYLAVDSLVSNIADTLDDKKIVSLPLLNKQVQDVKSAIDVALDTSSNEPSNSTSDKSPELNNQEDIKTETKVKVLPSIIAKVESKAQPIMSTDLDIRNRLTSSAIEATANKEILDSEELKVPIEPVSRNEKAGFDSTIEGNQGVDTTIKSNAGVDATIKSKADINVETSDRQTDAETKNEDKENVKNKFSDLLKSKILESGILKVGFLKKDFSQQDATSMTETYSQLLSTRLGVKSNVVDLIYTAFTEMGSKRDDENIAKIVSDVTGNVLNSERKLNSFNLERTVDDAFQCIKSSITQYLNTKINNSTAPEWTIKDTGVYAETGKPLAMAVDIDSGKTGLQTEIPNNEAIRNDQENQNSDGSKNNVSVESAIYSKGANQAETSVNSKQDLNVSVEKQQKELILDSSSREKQNIDLEAVMKISSDENNDELKASYSKRLKARIIETGLLEAFIKNKPTSEDFSNLVDLFSKKMAEILHIKIDDNTKKALRAGLSRASVNSFDCADVFSNTTASFLIDSGILKSSNLDEMVNAASNSLSSSISESLERRLNQGEYVPQITEKLTNENVQQGFDSNNLINGNIQQGFDSSIQANGNIQQGIDSNIQANGNIQQGFDSDIQANGNIQQGFDSNIQTNLGLNMKSSAEVKNKVDINKDVAVPEQSNIETVIDLKSNLNGDLMLPDESKIDASNSGIDIKLDSAATNFNNQKRDGVKKDEVFVDRKEKFINTLKKNLQDSKILINLAKERLGHQDIAKLFNVYSQLLSENFQIQIGDDEIQKFLNEPSKLNTQAFSTEDYAELFSKFTGDILFQKKIMTPSNADTQVASQNLLTSISQFLNAYKDTSSLTVNMNQNMDNKLDVSVKSDLDVLDQSQLKVLQNNKEANIDSFLKVNTQKDSGPENRVSVAVNSATKADSVVIDGEKTNLDIDTGVKSNISNQQAIKTLDFDLNKSRSDQNVERVNKDLQSVSVDIAGTLDGTKQKDADTKASAKSEQKIKQKFATDFGKALASSNDFRLSIITRDMEMIISAIGDAVEAASGPEASDAFLSSYNTSLKT